MEFDPHKLQNIQRLALTTLAILLVLAGGLVWGRFKEASGIGSEVETENQGVYSQIGPAVYTEAGLKGQTLFREKCQRCHLVDRRMTGPALMNVRNRWVDSTALYAWIKNSQALVTSGNRYANEMFKTYSNSIMPAFPELSDNDIYCILEYIRCESDRPRMISER